MRPPRGRIHFLSAALLLLAAGAVRGAGAEHHAFGHDHRGVTAGLEKAQEEC